MSRCLLLLLFVFPRFALGQADPAPAAGFVRKYAAHYRVLPELIAALIDVESRWNPRAVSNRGAVGLFAPESVCPSTLDKRTKEGVGLADSF